MKSFRISAGSYGACTDWKQSNTSNLMTFADADNIESGAVYLDPIMSTNNHGCSTKRMTGGALRARTLPLTQSESCDTSKALRIVEHWELQTTCSFRKSP